MGVIKACESGCPLPLPLPRGAKNFLPDKGGVVWLKVGKIGIKILVLIGFSRGPFKSAQEEL